MDPGKLGFLWARLIREGYHKAPGASFIIYAGDLVNHAHG
jgi:hypothetical protein